MVVSKGHVTHNIILLWLSIVDGLLTLLPNFPFVDTIHLQGNLFVMGVKIKT